MPSQEKILHIKGLKTYFPVRKGLLRTVAAHVKAVDGVDLEIYRGETLGLVGESGCGKTTLGKSIIQLVGAVGGQILYHEGEQTFDLLNLSPEEFKHIRQKIQIVFQDPYGSLNPRQRIGSILEEPLKINRPELTASERTQQAREMMQRVGLRPEHFERYPHMFSGGQRQRIAVARALMLNPKVLVLDEPVSALDLSIQSQILNLLTDLQDQLGLAYLFISHDLSVVRHMADEVIVMYLGRPVEHGPKDDIFKRPQHPYTKALLSATPIADPKAKKQRIKLEGELPSPLDVPPGCAFAPRCWKAQDRCRQERPLLPEKLPAAACFFPES